MKTTDDRLPARNQNTIKAADFILVTFQLQVRSAMRNGDHGLAAAYAELAAIVQDRRDEARAEGQALIHTDKPEAALAEAR